MSQPDNTGHVSVWNWVLGKVQNVASNLINHGAQMWAALFGPIGAAGGRLIDSKIDTFT